MTAGIGDFRPVGPPDAYAPRSYHQLLRGPQYHWWRVVASSLMVVIGGFSLYVMWSFAILGLVHLFPVVKGAAGGGAHSDTFNLLATNAMLATAVPLTLAATWGAHGQGPGWVASVAGRFRWLWFMLSVGLCLMLQIAGTAVMYALSGAPRGPGHDVVLLLSVVLLTTPLQAAGEEFLFRGWLTQNVGALIPHRAASLIISTLVSGGLFALAHGQQNLWLIGDRFAFALVASFLVWQTGGLEAGTALHAVNNMVVFIPVILVGSVHETMNVTTTSASMVGLDLVILSLTAILLLWAFRRWGGGVRLSQPPIRWQP